MTAAQGSNPINSKSLAGRIRDAEQQVSRRQREVGVRTGLLVKDLHHQLTTPASLLLASGIGFLIGELTQHNPPQDPCTADKPRAGNAMPLETALNFIALVRTVYTAVLPITWLVKYTRQPDASSRASNAPPDPVAPDSGSVDKSAADPGQSHEG